MEKAKTKKYKHHMIREIYEQPEITERIIDEYVDFNLSQINIKELNRHVGRIKKIKRFVFLGCGSSANASLLGNYYFEEFSGKNCEYEFADEFISRRAILEPGTAVILLSQSGRTRDVIVAAEIAKKRGAYIISITNNSGSKLDRMSDIAINTKAGTEKGMAATKSFSSQILILFLVSLYFGDLFQNKILKKKEIYKELSSLAKKQIKMLGLEKEIIRVAKIIAKKSNIIVTGRRYNFPIALEGAHKIKETAYIHAEGIASEELRHGGEAMLDKSFSIVSLVPTDTVFKENMILVHELKRTKSSIFVFSDKKIDKLGPGKNIPLIKTIDPLTPFMSLILLQLLAYHLAVVKGIDIDKPRNIQKFVA